MASLPTPGDRADLDDAPAHGLRILQVNCQRSRAVMVEVGQVLAEGRFDAALLQEPYLRAGGFVAGLPAWMRVFQGGGGGSAVVIANALLDATVVSVAAGDWGATVWVRGGFGGIYLSSVYCRHGEPLNEYLIYLEWIFSNLSEAPVLAGMDANAVSRLWFSKNRIRGAQNAARGDDLEAFIVAGDVEVLNEPSQYFTFDGPRGRSDIDVTLGRGVERLFRPGWEIRPDLVQSDHNAIVVTLLRRDGRADRPQPVAGWRAVDVDWPAYGAALAAAAVGLVGEGLEGMEPVALAERITAMFCDVNDALLGPTSVLPRRRSRWWCRELTLARRLARRARTAWQRARRRGIDGEELVAFRSTYRMADRNYKRLLLEKKEDNWRTFVGTVGNADPWGDVYRICRRRRRPADIGGIRAGGVLTTSWEASARALLDRFFPRAPDQGPDQPAPREPGELPGPPDPITALEIRLALKRMKLRGAPGPDGITTAMVRALASSDAGLSALLAMYNGCLEAGVFPPRWKGARVVALLKGPGRPLDEPGSYRPISLLPALGKLFEKILVRRLEARACHTLSDRQFGFRAGRGTEDAWHEVMRIVEESPHKYVLGTFVDFKGAFDNLSWATILGILEAAGCPEMGVWRSFFSDRCAFMVSRFGRVEVEVERGCPQGSMSGPLFWNLALDSLLRRLVMDGREVVAYADDTLLLTPGDSRRDIESRASESLRTVDEWGAGAAVEVSRDKTVCMLLRGRLSGGRHPRVLLGRGAVPYRGAVKYLGIRVGERLNFGLHLHDLRERTCTLVCELRRVMRPEWGLRRGAIKTLYRGLFLPCAMYGASVWGGFVRARVTSRALLNRAQRSVLLAALSVCRTVSTDAMTVLLGELPWDLEAKKAEAAFYIRKGLPVPWEVQPADGGGENATVRSQRVREHVWREWGLRWGRGSSGGVTRSFVPVPAGPAKLLRSVGFGTRAGFLLTGHGSLNGFLYRRALSESPRCPCGEGEETALHVLIECPIYHERRDLHAMGIDRAGQGPWDVQGAVNSPEAYGALRSFASWVFEKRAQVIAGM